MKIRVLAVLTACLLVCAGCSSLHSFGQTPRPSPSTSAPPPRTSTSSEPSTSSAPTSSTPTSSTSAGSAAPSGEVTSAAPEPTGSAGFDPRHEFDGAATADPQQFPGTVTTVGFTSPSGNIACGFGTGAVVCQLSDYTYRPEPAHDCHGAGDWGTTVRLEGRDAAGFACAGDVEGGGPVLPYGHQLIEGATRCVSRQDGVTCENTTTGKGFWLARQAYLFFPAGAAVVPQALVGQWVGHGRALTIAASGATTLVYRAYRMCSDDPTPPCDELTDNQIVDGGKVRATLTSSRAPTEADGTITSSDDPQYRVGQSVTVTLDGHEVTVRLGGSPFAPFCDPDAAAPGECGA